MSPTSGGGHGDMWSWTPGATPLRSSCCGDENGASASLPPRSSLRRGRPTPQCSLGGAQHLHRFDRRGCQDVKATVYHVQLNVADAGASVPFYRELLGYLEYRVMVGRDDLLGMSNGTTDFGIFGAGGDGVAARLHRKNPGLNHVAFR